MYVYIQSEKTLWTAGFYSPDGKWHPESDYFNPISAANRVAYLNGRGTAPAHTSLEQYAANNDIKLGDYPLKYSRRLKIDENI